MPLAQTHIWHLKKQRGPDDPDEPVRLYWINPDKIVGINEPQLRGTEHSGPWPKDRKWTVLIRVVCVSRLSFVFYFEDMGKAQLFVRQCGGQV